MKDISRKLISSFAWFQVASARQCS